MEEFEPSSDAWNQEWKSSSQVRGLQSEMEEFEASSDAWNRGWKSSSQVRGLESGLEESETSLRLGIGNGGVRAKFDPWNWEWRSSR